MTHEQLKLLSQMKKLIKNGKCRFQVRNDRDYLEELLNLGISEREAWNYILTLNSNFYVHDFKPNYLINGESLIFKRLINGNIANNNMPSCKIIKTILPLLKQLINSYDGSKAIKAKIKEKVVNFKNLTKHWQNISDIR